MVINFQISQLGAAGVTGAVNFAAGEHDRGIITFTPDTTGDPRLQANLVVTMSDGRITAMQDHRRRSRAIRAAKA